MNPKRRFSPLTTGGKSAPRGGLRPLDPDQGLRPWTPGSQAITCPPNRGNSTLVLWGKEDRLLPPSEGMRLASEIRNARFVALPDAGHLPQEEVSAEFSRAVAGFLDENEGVRSGLE